MTDERRAELRRIAEAATPGKRIAVFMRPLIRQVLRRDDGHFIASADNDDAVHIAAFERETCLSLLDAADRVAALEAEVEAVKESESMLDTCADVYQERAFAAEQRIATLEAELAALKGATNA